ncbi:threonine--tRNA ligase [Candidatus Nardonella dryophthoridicola]|uniref:Threonine--tRNA ligase n=1 Tax=endosymbiont of Rhynchophorus ferrugineus TaxID=1972133 RepID=A0A2Z5T410_9GAMM|nr:threonine--tRNA ligase [Candidatus Nardonella dryophthoridicola]BBA85128.1 threonine--tRNA ligase [endosymbiont of Rhynchophorus ferrugineus]
MKNIYNSHIEINKKIKLYHLEKNSIGMIFWNKNGLIIFNELINLIRNKLNFYNYIEVKTPILLSKNLFTKSGHIDFFLNNMFVIDNKNLCVKPMNCPAHIKIFKNNLYSYKELPIKILEFGTCTRLENTGSIYGLLRTRSFTQDDTHIFCDNKDIECELNECIKLMYEIYNIFNFKNIEINFSTRPIKKIGDENIWNKSESIIINILNKNKLNYTIKKGEGAFYGPKIEFILQDYLNRKWQCGTIQLDFITSKRLNSTYIYKNNEKKYPIIIHKAILGSIERFIGIITEHYQGTYPLWISPIQIIILSISEKYIKYVYNLKKIFIKNNIRCEIDINNKKIEYKIKKYIELKIPYIIIYGKNELINKNISIRKRNSKNILKLNIKEFIKKIKIDIKNKI